jgi:small subunit ribosomal protein S6
MLQTYETIFILQPELTEEEMDSTVGTFEELLKERKAEVAKTEKWGKKRLAYRVRRFWEGFYVLFEYTSDGATLDELERRLRIHDNVIKWMSVRKDPRAAAEEERRAARMAKAASMRPDGDSDGDDRPRRSYDDDRPRRSFDDDDRPSHSRGRRDDRPERPARRPAPARPAAKAAAAGEASATAESRPKTSTDEEDAS